MKSYLVTLSNGLTVTIKADKAYAHSTGGTLIFYRETAGASDILLCAYSQGKWDTVHLKESPKDDG